MLPGDASPRMAALGNETRLGAYRLLVRAGGEGLSVAAVQKRLGVPASTLCHHPRALREVGLITQKRQGTTLICRADFDVLRETFEWLEAECCIDAANRHAPSIKHDDTNPCCGPEAPQGASADAGALERPQ